MYIIISMKIMESDYLKKIGIIFLVGIIIWSIYPKLSNIDYAEELLKITSSQWATSKDIMIIGCVGRNKAYSIMQEISLQYYKDNRLRNKRLQFIN